MVNSGSPRPPAEGRESGRALPNFILAGALLALGLVILATAVTVYAIFTASTSVTPNDFASDTLDPATGLGATGGASVDLSWTATADTYASGHRVLRGTTTGGPYTQIAEVTPRTTTTYTDSPADGTYYYVLRSFVQNWESVNSGEATATVGGCAATPISRSPDSFSEDSSLTIGATALDTEDYTATDHPGQTKLPANYVPANEFYADHPTTNGGAAQFLIIVWDEACISGGTITTATLDLSGWVDGGFWQDTPLGGIYSTLASNPSFEYSTDGGSTWTSHSAGIGAITAVVAEGDAAWDRVDIDVATDIQAIADASQTSIQFRLGFDRGHGAIGGPPVRAFSIDHAFLDVTYTSSGPPPAGAVSILDAWTTGTTHTVSAGTNRLLLVGVYGEDSGVISSINTVTWGGQTLTEIGEATVGTGYSNLVWMGYLDEAGIAAASGSTIVATWSGTTPNESVLYAAVTLENVNQTTPIGGSSTGTNTSASTVQIASALTVSADDMAVYVTVSGEQGRTHTADTGYTEGTEEDSGGIGQVASNATKAITSAGTEQPTATWSGGANNRLGIVGAVINVAP